LIGQESAHLQIPNDVKMMVMNQWVEQDGLARSVLVILFMTTVGCFAYTWGYYEVRNLMCCHLPH
jgi:hypothetical protein